MSGRDVHEAHEVHKSTILTDREKGWLQQDWDEQAEAVSEQFAVRELQTIWLQL